MLTRICYYLTSKSILLATPQVHQRPQPPQNVGPGLFSLVQEHVFRVGLELGSLPPSTQANAVISVWTPECWSVSHHRSYGMGIVLIVIWVTVSKQHVTQLGKCLR